MTSYNTGIQIKNFLDDPAKPMSMEEFLEFWDTLSDEEKTYYRGVELLG